MEGGVSYEFSVTDISVSPLKSKVVHSGSSQTKDSFLFNVLSKVQEAQSRVCSGAESSNNLAFSLLPDVFLVAHKGSQSIEDSDYNVFFTSLNFTVH